MKRNGLFVLFILSSPVLAHDTWVETNTNLIRVGDAVYIDLKLGNHGNEHRDFKLASKTDLDSSTLNVIAPDGTEFDVKDRLLDMGYAPKEGYWTAKFAASKPGLYTVAHTRDSVVNHGRATRSIKSGKTFFMVSASLDDVELNHRGFDQVFGHPLELVPKASPVAPMGPGQPIIVEVLFKAKKLPGIRVSFIPSGETLKEEFDERYERMSDKDGLAKFTPTTGNRYLVVAHHLAENESGNGFDATTYSATLTVFVPEICPCCSK